MLKPLRYSQQRLNRPGMSVSKGVENSDCNRFRIGAAQINVRLNRMQLFFDHIDSCMMNFLKPVCHIKMYLVYAASADGVMGVILQQQLPQLAQMTLRVHGTSKRRMHGSKRL